MCIWACCAFTGLANSLGRDASPNEMGRGPMGHRGTLLDQVSIHLPDTCCTLIADRGLTGMPLVKLCTARGWRSLCASVGTYLSAILGRQTGTVVEAL